MLKLPDLKPHMVSYGIDYAYAFNIRKQDPDELVTIRELPGPTLKIEESIHSPILHITTRGPKESQYAARDMAHLIDSFFLDRDIFPFMAGTTYVLYGERVSGGPAFLETDEFNRSLYVATYALTSSR